MSQSSSWWGAFRGAALTAAVVTACATGAHAQTGECTKTASATGEALTCRGGLVIRAESGSLYSVKDTDGDGRPDEVELTGRGLLLELPPSQGRGSFQIRTPHAIASVRGTVWAVDVTSNRTSVFVEQGVVNVSRPSSPGSVNLNAGSGIDVDESGNALRALPWPKERSDALLARFGR